jgi:crotonobetainyl-CoA hydratase
LTSSTVTVERRGHTLLVTINRPEVRNAVDRQTATRLGAVVEQADADDDTWAVVLTGAGVRAFCAGGDLKALARGESLRAEGHEDWGFAGYVKHFISKPTIAAVNGAALGGGLEIVLACDLAVAARRATFGLPDVRNGSIAGAGGLVRLPVQIPRKLAMEMILTGEQINAEQARQWGLVNSVVDDDCVVEEAMKLAEKICQGSPRAVQASKRAAYGLVEGEIVGESALWELSRKETEAIWGTPDWLEGLRPFVKSAWPDESTEPEA